MAKKKTTKKAEKPVKEKEKASGRSVASYTKTAKEIKIHSLFPADFAAALERLQKTKKDITFKALLSEVLKEHGKHGITYPLGVKSLLFG